MEKESTLTILLLTTEFNPCIAGGLGRHVTDLVFEGRKKDLQFIVVTISETDNETYETDKGVHIFRLKPWQTKSGSFIEHMKNINFRFSQFVLEELHLSFDLIHVHDWLTGLSGIQLKTLLKRPLITTFHATEEGRKFGKVNSMIAKITAVERKLVERSNQLIVCSYYMKDVLRNDLGCSARKLEVIPNGIIPQHYQILTEKKLAVSRFPFIYSPFLLAMGRLVEEKGFHLLIEAFTILYKQFPQYSLVIAGAGPYSDRLQELAKRHNLERAIIFTGFVYENERNMLLNHCDFLIIPSLYEPFGIIALEGMITGRPVIAFKCGGLKEILEENRGILVDEVNGLSLAKAIEKAILEPEKTKETASKGQDAAKKLYTMSILIEKTAELYKKVIQTDEYKNRFKK